MSPDWAAKAEPIPYAKLDNPQSFNLYGYVENNPLSMADADGHISTYVANGCGGPPVGCEGKDPEVIKGEVAQKDTQKTTEKAKPAPALQQNSSQDKMCNPQATSGKPDTAFAKVGNLVPNPFKLFVTAYKLYRDKEYLKDLKNMQNRSVDVMLNTSGHENAASIGFAADNYMWARREIIRAGGATAYDAVSLAEGIQNNLRKQQYPAAEKKEPNFGTP